MSSRSVRRVKRGFTLIELAFVIALLGILAAATVPAYSGMVGRSRAAEARTMLETIAHAELTFRRDHGAFLECKDERPVPRGAGVASGGGCLEKLGVRFDGPVRYRYQVELPKPDSFRVTAEGDLDGDGKTSLFTLEGDTMNLVVRDELE